MNRRRATHRCCLPRTRHGVRALVAALGAVLSSGPALAADDAAGSVEFSDGFMIGGKAIDMSRYANGNPVAAGDYVVDIYVNDDFLRTQEVLFVSGDESAVASPCLSAALVSALPLKSALIDAVLAQGRGCLDLASVVEGSGVVFDSATLRLSIGIPQAAQARSAQGFVAPELREDGITAAFVDYSANHFQGRSGASSYLGLHAGVNLGPWRLRHRTSFTRTGAGTQRQTISSHLQRDVPGWNSQLLLGQGNTGGELFDSVGFTGLRLATDERMLPDSLRGYAPVVRGIAESTAVVTIRQNGSIIHESTVPPGPFAIDDLYPTSFGGDLEVSVTEADGRVQRFVANFSAVPQALRVGASRYSFTAGELRDNGAASASASLRFAEGTYARGLSNRFTVLGGVQLGEDYRAVLAGGAITTPIGAIGADITRSRARLPGRTLAGSSLRLNYQRYVARTGTHFGLAAYRYSTRGFLSLGDLARANADHWGDVGRARQRYQLNITQRLSQRTSLYLSGGHVAYWGRNAARNDFQLGVQSSRGTVNYGISALRYQLPHGGQDTRYALTLSMPLGRSRNAPRASAQLGRGGDGTQSQLGISGSRGETAALSYSVSASQARGASYYGGYAAWQGGNVHLNAAYTHGNDYRSLALGAAGSVVLHRHGVTFGAPVGDGFALIAAPGAQGARVGGSSTLRVGHSGYTVLPHVSPYRWNVIDLDPSGLPIEVELLQTSLRVAPTAGGIVSVPFDVRRDRTLFIDAAYPDGSALPFAAPVTTADGQPKGAVGQGGVIQLRGAQDRGELIVNPGAENQCRIAYTLPTAKDAYGLSWTESTCEPIPASLIVPAGPATDVPPPATPTAPSASH